MEKKVLILHIPVIHKGYLDFLKQTKDEVSDVFVIDEQLLAELSEFKPDIASFDANTAMGLLQKLGFENISILAKENIGQVSGRILVLVQDEVSRNLYSRYLMGNSVEWKSVFLRWDKGKVLVQQKIEGIPTSNHEFDIEMIKMASKESEKSGEWWRRIGAVLTKDRQIVLGGNNKDLPSDHTPYQVGEVRDFFNTGERPDLANTIHAEQSIIAKAAKEGISVNGLSLYVTTFPCPVCAKMIAYSGIKNVYFAEGWSNFDAIKVLESAGVRIVQVPL